MRRTPAVTLVVPEYVFAPESVTVSNPCLVNPKEPEITPFISSNAPVSWLAYGVPTTGVTPLSRPLIPPVMF